MGRWIVMLAGIAAAGTALAPTPARAEFFTVGEMRALCRGEMEEAPEFRTDAGYRLLAQVARERCRMYLLGLAEARLQGIERETGARCLPAWATDALVADMLVEALAEGREQAGATLDALVEETLRLRFGCPERAARS